MVKSRRELQQVPKQHGWELAKFGVRLHGLFGLFLHDTVTGNRDVDLLVKFDSDE